jgi:hypothetical protein
MSPFALALDRTIGIAEAIGKAPTSTMAAAIEGRLRHRAALGSLCDDRTLGNILMKVVVKVVASWT